MKGARPPREEYLVEVHVIVKAASRDIAEAKVTQALGRLVRNVPGADNAYISDVRHEGDSPDADA